MCVHSSIALVCLARHEAELAGEGETINCSEGRSKERLKKKNDETVINSTSVCVLLNISIYLFIFFCVRSSWCCCLLLLHARCCKSSTASAGSNETEAPSQLPLVLLLLYTVYRCCPVVARLACTPHAPTYYSIACMALLEREKNEKI